MELQDILVRFNDELRALTEYVRTRKPALLHLVPVVNFMLGDSTLNPETAATNMRRLEAELADEKPKPEKPRTSKPKKPTVKFGNHPQITIEGEPYPLTFEQAQWLDALIDAGDWMSDGKYNRDNNRTSRPDRLRKQLPKEVQRHIETTKSSGSRWR